MAFSLPGRFLSFLPAVGSTGDSLKSTCKSFLGGVVSYVFKVGVVLLFSRVWF